MSEQELLRTALVLPPRARRVVCVWAAVPGLVCAPFAFWQSVWAGAVFCVIWAALVALVRARCCSFVAALTADSVTVQSGSALLVVPSVTENSTRPGSMEVTVPRYSSPSGPQSTTSSPSLARMTSARWWASLPVSAARPSASSRVK